MSGIFRVFMKELREPIRNVQRLLQYYKDGGFRIITETEKSNLALFYGVLTQCLAAAMIGSWLGNLVKREEWDIFNLCKVLCTAFFFLPHYCDSRQMDRRHLIAIVLASFFLAFGRDPSMIEFTDTYTFALHSFPTAGIHLLARSPIDMYNKLNFTCILWLVIFGSLYIACPMLVNIFGFVPFRQFVYDCVLVAIWYIIHVEVILVLYMLNLNNTCWEILIQIFFQSGGWNIVFRIFFGFLLCAIVYSFGTGAFEVAILHAGGDRDELAIVGICTFFGCIWYLCYLLALGFPMQDRQDRHDRQDRQDRYDSMNEL